MYLTHTHKYLTHTHKYLTHTHNTHNVHSRAKKLANKEGKKLYAQVDRVPEEEAMAIVQVCRYTCVCVLMCVCQILMYVCQILMYVCQILMYVLSRFLSLFLYRASLFFLILSLDLSYTGVCVYVYVGTRVCVCMYVSVAFVGAWAFLTTGHWLEVSCVCTGRRRLIECLKSQVIFRKRATNSRALLLKMTHEDTASNDSTPLCMSIILRELILCGFTTDSISIFI